MATVGFNQRPKGVVEQEPVREFTGDHHRLARTLLQMLEAERNNRVDEIARRDCKTFDEYRNLRGKIDGLDIAINFCKEAQRKLEA